MPATPPSPRERILHAALTLLETGGPEAVSTRSVCSAAHVQAPTIYRLYGSMDGLLDAVAGEGYARYLHVKEARPDHDDPVAQLRAGWDGHVAYGLAHPHLYTLMFGAPGRPARHPAAQRAGTLLHGLLARIAAQGGLTVDPARAAALVHSGAVGVTLTLLDQNPPDPQLSATLREAVLNAILDRAPDRTGPAAPGPARAAVHAVALAALLPELSGSFTPSERALLTDWLARIRHQP